MESKQTKSNTNSLESNDDNNIPENFELLKKIMDDVGIIICKIHSLQNSLKQLENFATSFVYNNPDFNKASVEFNNAQKEITNFNETITKIINKLSLVNSGTKISENTKKKLDVNIDISPSKKEEEELWPFGGDLSSFASYNNDNWNTNDNIDNNNQINEEKKGGK